MKKLFFILNLIIFVVASAFVGVTTLFSIITLLTPIEILLPFAITLNYLSLILATLSFLINVITYAIRKGNKLLAVSIIFLLLAFATFLITLLV